MSHRDVDPLEAEKHYIDRATRFAHLYQCLGNIVFVILALSATFGANDRFLTKYSTATLCVKILVYGARLVIQTSEYPQRTKHIIQVIGICILVPAMFAYDVWATYVLMAGKRTVLDVVFIVYICVKYITLTTGFCLNCAFYPFNPNAEGRTVSETA